MVDCAALEDSTIDDSVKVIYAVYLAICELKSTGISYPKECNDLKNSEAPKRQICITKLEEKPQYWTTLSNNLQNALIICAAARQEVEKGLSHFLSFTFIMGLWTETLFIREVTVTSCQHHKSPAKPLRCN